MRLTIKRGSVPTLIPCDKEDAPPRPPSGGPLETLGNLRDGCAAAAGYALDRSPRLTTGKHAGNPVVAINIFWAAPIEAFRLGLTYLAARAVGRGEGVTAADARMMP